MLQGQFSELQGLASPVLGQKVCFPKFDGILGYNGQTYMQVLHNDNNHWITIEIVSQEEVHIYDSLFSKPNYCIIKQISSIIQSKSHEVQLVLEKVQFQKNAIDCGVYAIAFLTDLYATRLILQLVTILILRSYENIKYTVFNRE